MIRKLRRRMTILVAAVLLLVTSGIVFSINYLNWRNIVTQAKEALETLADNSGVRPEIRKADAPEPRELPGSAKNEQIDQKGSMISEESMISEGSMTSEESVISKESMLTERETTVAGSPPEKPPQDREDEGMDRRRPSRGQPIDADDALASLSNYYVVTLSSDDSMTSWTSDRSDLYTDEQVMDLTEIILAEGKTSGRVGTQFYRLTNQGGKKMLIILDERLDILNAQNVLRTTIIIASIACLLLCAAAYVLIRFMVKPVQEAFDRQRQFVWDASHELKTPLAVIGANADVLEGEMGSNEHLAYIQSEVKRTNQLVQNLLTLARMDKGKTTTDLKELDLGKTVLSVALPFESTAFEEGKKFEIDVQEGIMCTGDAAMLQQLTVILLGNALKYSDPGGSIKLQVSARGKYREIRVSNTGEGIAPDDLEKIFDRFYRVDSAHNREVEGYGLGLSIAKNIVDVHKGKISVTSELFGETVFTVSLQR